MGPDYPYDVPVDQRQVDGDQKNDNLSETHRRNASLAPKPSGDPGYLKTTKIRGALRYREV